MGKARRQRGVILVETLYALRERSRGQCEACGKERAMHAHHVQYRSRGGDSSLKNLAHLCAGCHNRVHNGDPKFAKFRRNSWEKAPTQQSTPAWQNAIIFGRVK